MKEPEVIEQIHALNSEDQLAVERLVETIRNESKKTPEALISLWTTGSAEDVEKAITIMMELDDIVLIPLLDNFDNCNPQQRLQSISLAVDTQLSIRKIIVQKLNQLLDDVSLIPVEEIPGSAEEEAPIPMRICDEAYLLMRQLLKMDEKEVDFELNSSEFIELPTDLRNVEIQRARKSEAWTVWIKDTVE